MKNNRMKVISANIERKMYQAELSRYQELLAEAIADCKSRAGMGEIYEAVSTNYKNEIARQVEYLRLRVGL